MWQFREELRPTDTEEVRALVAATGMFRPNEIAVAAELVDDRLRLGAASGYKFVLAEESGRLVGYACFGPITVTLHGYDLYWIVVSPEYQGQGIGRRLLAEAEARIRAAGGRQIYIETSGQGGYEPTRQFYRRCGYELVATIADFYAPGDDKLIYVRRM